MIQDRQYKRDSDSKALINTNRKAFEERKRLKQQMKKQSEMETDINNIKDDLEEIKKMLKNIANRIE